MNEFAENMRRLRIERDLSQDALAERIGTSKQVLSRYETGARIPKISMVQKIADALGVSLSELTGKEENPPQPPKRRKWRMLSAGALNLPDEQLDKLYAMAHVLCPDDFPLEEDEEERKDEK